MKRDMELCRKILLAVEEQCNGDAIEDLAIDGYTHTQVGEHCKMMYEYGLLQEFRAINADGCSMIMFFVGEPTWEGHDFLDKVREDTVWNKTKETIKGKGLPMIFDVIKDVAAAVITSMTKAAISGMI